MADQQHSFDTNEWLQVASGIAHIFPTSSEMFTLPANMSANSLWNFEQLAAHDDALIPLVSNFPSQSMEQKLKSNQGLHSNVTDPNVQNSPMSIKPEEEEQRIPFEFSPIQNGPTLLHHAVHSKHAAHPASTFSNLPSKPSKTIQKKSSQNVVQPLSFTRYPGRVKPGPKVKHFGVMESQKKPVADEDGRVRHNKMMRENRTRFNNKFKELEDLLGGLQDRTLENKPMKNKIQILERAMLQYALMEAKRARFKHDLIFSPTVPDSIPTHLLDVIGSTPTVKDACELVVRAMCCSMDWKYAEVWVRNSLAVADCVSNSNCYALSTAFVSPINVLSTRNCLGSFAKRSQSLGMGNMMLKLSFLRNPIWIPDITTKHKECRKALVAKEYGITTTLIVPVFLNDSFSSPPDAIISLMHADDELLPFPGGVRPYHPESVSKITDLVAAVVQANSRRS